MKQQARVFFVKLGQAGLALTISALSLFAGNLQHSAIAKPPCGNCGNWATVRDTTGCSSRATDCDGASDNWPFYNNHPYDNYAKVIQYDQQDCSGGSKFKNCFGPNDYLDPGTGLQYCCKDLKSLTCPTNTCS